MKGTRSLLLQVLLFASVLLAVAAAIDVEAETALRVEVLAPLGEHHGWTMSRKRAAPEGSLTFFVELNTGKEDLVARTAESVSDPKSPSYGKYLSAEELRELVAAPQEVEDHVTQWLHATRIAHDEPLEVESYGDVLRVSTTVQNTEQLFDTQLAHFTHSESQRSAVLITSSATLPVDISQYVRGVVGLAEVMTSHHVTRWANKNQKNDHRQSEVPVLGPQVLRAYYNVSSDLFASPEVSQGIISFNDAFSPKALQTFCEAFDLNVPEVIQVNGVDSNVPGTSGRVLAHGESDLDVQYITAMARNATTYHHNNDNAEFGFYWWALEVAASPNPAMVYSMSWGMDETSLRGRKVHSITSMDDKLARLALRGITILASAGDFGACGGSQACPVESYCPAGGCEHNTTKCMQILVTNDFGTVSFPSTFGWLFSRPTDLNPVREFLRKQEGCNATVEWDNAGQPWLYSECECSDFKWMDLGTARFRDWTPATASWPKLTAAYPASSVWVTSVGGTEWSIEGEEIVGAYGPDSISYYTTGGGFSAIFPRQPWQEGSVSAYLANDSIQSELPPTSVYRAEGRAFPDISLVGANYLIAYAGPTGKDEPLIFPVQGTSCSAPTLAGMITLINQMRLDAGKPQLGFLNPILYQMARDRPEAFHDVVTGSNKGTTGYTCQYGWPAASGWDAASGLGTPNFGIMADYLLNFDAC